MYQSLTPKMALDLAAPHTWPAALMPLLVAVALASTCGAVSITLTLDMLAIVVLMQSSVNTFNDYYDFKKGTDTQDAQLAEDDAVLVYNNIDPHAARNLAVVFLVLAFLLGIYPICVAGFAPLIIALVAALFVVLYSAGKTPLSYLPLGELASGLCMGGLIPLAAFCVLTGKLDPFVLLVSLPEIIGVGLIMLTNNISDIERDEIAGRKTLAVLLGRPRTRTLYRALLIAWMCALCAIVALWFTPGALLLPFMLLTALSALISIFKSKLTQAERLRTMPLILNLNVILGLFYAFAIFVSPLLSLML